MAVFVTIAYGSRSSLQVFISTQVNGTTRGDWQTAHKQTSAQHTYDSVRQADEAFS